MPPKKQSSINNTRSLRSRAGASAPDSQQLSATTTPNQQRPASSAYQQTSASLANQQISFSTPAPAEESVGMRIVDDIIEKSRQKIFKKV